MSTTTVAAIRDRMIALVRALVPTVESGTKFVPYREQLDFRSWAEAHPDACLRRFSIATRGQVSPPEVTNTDVERVWVEMEAVVAYPVNSRFGERALASLHDVIASDLQQMEHRIGTNGYALYAASNPAATVLTLDTDRENGPVVMFGVLVLRVGFFRSMA